jgi:hypothetical protein
MRSLFRFFVCSLFFVSIAAGVVRAQVSVAGSMPDHPRLLLLKGEEKQIQVTVQSDPTWRSIHQHLLAACDSMIGKPPVEHIKIGRRLLDKSRECLRRVFFLSYAWRMTHDQRYLARAEKELLAVSAFSDWNPSHFLDVAEMTMAVSIGYDWLYNDLSASSRATIKNAILKNGLEPSLDPKLNGWLTATNNWNQVCNAGILYGALAVYEDQPEQSVQIINRSIKAVDLPMKEYAPDGAYPEGYNYWGYGTSFNVMLISALEKIYHSDFGLAEKTGFLKTAAYLEHMVGASHHPFNFADAGSNEELHPAMFWFAERTKDPTLLWMERGLVREEKSRQYISERTLPTIMIWGKNILFNDIKPPAAAVWSGNGKNPVALMRSSWSDTATFIGFKGGSPSSSHAHMDAGSFVMDAEGVRWAMDFGMQDYESLESKGVDLWNFRQNSQRWQVFRYNNFAHNTITVNGRMQHVAGKGEISYVKQQGASTRAVADLTQLYSPVVENVRRGIALLDNAYVVVRDEISTGDTVATIRWTMATAATPTKIDDHTWQLEKSGKKLLLQVREPATVQLKTWSTDPVQPYDAANPGTILVGFEVQFAPKTKGSIDVLLVPGKAINIPKQKPIPLSEWNNN